tara:strand:+ start:141 stop:1157 length:1017 start_codon:yes stop_codon:yes gene_type:complete
MPLRECTVDGKTGWQWGEAGKCYTGRDSKKQAIKQGIAIEGPEKFSQIASKQDLALSKNEIEAIANWMDEEGYNYSAIVATSALLFSYWSGDKKKRKRKDQKTETKALDDKDRQKRLEREEYDQDDRELRHEDLRQKLKHHQDAVKNLTKEIKSLEKDMREDKRDVREESRSAQMSRKEINNLPDADFAYIEAGGKKDSSGKTEPRSLRHLPIPDAAHVRNALARLPQTDISSEAKKSALQKIKAKAKKFGIEVSDASQAVYEGCRTTSMDMDSRYGYGHFHTFKPGDDHTSKARTSFGDIIITGHVHEIRDGRILEADGHVHDIRDVGPGDGWVYGG